ncbi:AbgT family transporter [Halomonas sp. MC140]|nr:AbgT family transporter [Halomonas sp. MC140]MDN7132337.1 AbgT family transporter [Halomonas sp. MC140]
MKSLTMNKNKSFFKSIPQPPVLLFFILVLVCVMSWVIPAGIFDREDVNGRQAVVPGSYHYVDSSPLNPLDLIFSIPQGLTSAGSLIFITLIAGGLFRIINTTGALENLVAVCVRRIGIKNKTLAVWFFTYVYGALGVVVGYETNIALIPVAVLVGRAIGGDVMVGLGIALGGIGFGFATSPINPYTVGISQSIAELPLFSGLILRTVLALTILSVVAHHTSRYLKKIQENPNKSLSSGVSANGLELKYGVEKYALKTSDIKVLLVFVSGLVFMLYGVFAHHWYINEIAGIFLATAVFCGFTSGMNTNDIVENLFKGASAVTSGALLIGLARAIQVLLDQGQIGDTIVAFLAGTIGDFPVVFSSIIMSVVHGLINILIPSGSGQAMATMPILIPLSDLVGMTRQVSVLAFQIGDGFTNLIAPTSGSTLAMLAMVGMPYHLWLRFAFPLVIKCFLVSFVFLAIAVMIGWQ